MSEEENLTTTKQLIEEEERAGKPHCLYPDCTRFVRVEYNPESRVTYYVCKRHGRIPKKWSGLPRGAAECQRVKKLANDVMQEDDRSRGARSSEQREQGERRSEN